MKITAKIENSKGQHKILVQTNDVSQELKKLVRHTDEVAEIQNTLRAGVKVLLVE